jgi:hypothetical protein
MPFPTPIVEIAFDDSPYAVNPTWTNVTSWVRSLSTSRGRSDDWDDFYGSAQIVLNNRTRLFDPYNTSGIYYGKLLPRKQIRIRAQTTDGGVTVTHDVFRGFINGWSPAWTDAGTDSTVTLSCFDALQLLGSEQLPASWADGYILSTSPRHYYPMDEPVTAFTGTTVLKDYGSVPLNLTCTTAASNGSRLASGVPSSSVTATANNVAIGQLGYQVPIFDISVSCWLQETTQGQQISALLGIRAFSINFVGNIIQVEIYDGTLRRQYDTAADYEPGIARHIGFSYNLPTSAFALYVNGIATPTTGSSSATSPIVAGETVNIGRTEAQQYVIWGTIQPQSTFQTIYNYSRAFIAETTTQRFNRIIAETPFSSALCSAPASPGATVLEINYGAAFAAPELRLVAASESAPIFVSKAGVLTMYQQEQQFTQTRSVVSQVTYGTGGTDMGQLFELMPDGDSVRNEANVNMSQGGVYTQKNTASIAAYGTASESIDTQVQTLEDAQTVASYAANFGGNVYPRLSPVQVVLDAANNWSPTMALELMDRITVNAQPPSGGNAINVPMLVQNIRHDAQPGLWQTTLEGSARWASVFILNQSLLNGTDLLG